MTLKVAVLHECAPGERRVALVPSVAARLGDLGCTITMQQGAGVQAGFPDEDYGAVERVETSAEALAGADIVLKVLPPTPAEVAELSPSAVCISHLQAHQNAQLVTQLAECGASALAMELIPRITRAQAMDALSSQATVTGYKAALLAAELSPRLFPMLTTAAGTIRPSRVVVIGAGVAGLQAIATTRRLGAQVEAYDIRPAAKEQVESLGAKLIDTGVNAEGKGGYARELTEEERQRQADALAKHLSKAHAVISTAAIPGRPAPKIITTAMVEQMLPGAVIIDLAAETGGNCELTEPGKTIHYHDKTIYGPLNLASSAATHASEMYAKNLLSLLSLLIVDGELKLDLNDEVVAGCLLTHGGAVIHPGVRQQLGLPALSATSPDVASDDTGSDDTGSDDAGSDDAESDASTASNTITNPPGGTN